MAEENKDKEDFNPGFIEDEVKESTDQSQHSDGPTFNPFSDVGQVDTGMAAVGSGPETNPAMGGHLASEGVGPGTASQPVAADPMDGVADEDIKPGQGRDLWVCPHCSAKNKPGRDTCRSCGKSPDDKVVPPIVKQLPLIIGGGVLALIVLAFLIFGGTDTSMRPAGPSGLDLDVRLDGGRIAASGRVLAKGPSDHGAIAVLLVFAPTAADDDSFSQLQPDISDTQINITRGGSLDTDIRYVLLHLVTDGELPALDRGDYLSVAGADVRKPTRRFEYIVEVESIADQ